MSRVTPRHDGDGSAEARLMRRAARASAAVALVLVVIKIGAWAMTGSVSLLSALIDSAVDVFASTVNLIAISIALAPPDATHRFGHTKAESLAALAQAALLIGSAGFLVEESASRLLAPQPIPYAGVGIAAMVAAMVLNGALYAFQRRVVARTGSLSIEADSYHSRSHLLVDGAVIAALALTATFGWLIADPLLGAAIAAYIGFGVWRIGRSAIDTLMDRELPAAQRQEILSIVCHHPEILDVADLRTRSAGLRGFVQLRIKMSPTLSFARAHAVSHEVEHDIRRAFPAVDVIVHVEPAAEPAQPERQA